MIKLLLRTFVGDYKNTSNAQVRKQVGQLSGVVGIVLNLFLAVGKIVVGILSGLVSVLADGLNNLTDCGSNVVALISFRLSSKPADKEHPFGHQRIEYIASMVVAFVVLVLAYQLASDSVLAIKTAFDADYVKQDVNLLTVTVLGVSILAKFWLFLFNKKLSKTYNSELLGATATDSISDVCSTSAVLVSLFLSRWIGFETDGFMGLIVAVIIAIAGVNIVKETFGHLLGNAPDKQLIDGIVARIKQYDGVYGVHDINVHNYGPNKYYASVHVEVDSAVSILDSHDMVDQIERDFAENTDIVLVVHMDPIVIGDPELDNYKKEITAIVKSLDEHFTIHDFRMVKGPTHTNLIFDVAIHFDTKLSNQQIVSYIQQQISAVHPTVYVVPTVEHQLD